MGTPMVENLLKGGHEVYVYDLKETNLRHVVCAGAISARNTLEVARHKDYVITSLPSPSALDNVMLGKGKIVESVGRGTLIVITDTVLPRQILSLAEEAAKRGVELVDSPVSGSVSRAITGELTAMIGGTKTNFDRAKPIVERIANRIHHVGPLGSGETVKLANNMMEYVNLTSMCEALVLIAKAGIRLQKFREIIQTSSGNSYVFAKLFDLMIAHKFLPPNAKTIIARKDLTLAKRLAEDLGIPTFVAGLSKELFELAVAKGYGDQDYTSLLKIYEEAARLDIKKHDLLERADGT